MKAVQYSVRLPMALDGALRKLAEQQDMTPYAMLQRSVKAGIAAETQSPLADTNGRELITEVASIGTRLADLERLLDRTLFTACAAYCYARSAAMGGGKSDEIILVEINRAYDRQMGIAEDRS
ncbi:hypothetical protein [Sphingopyxis sp.]|uniref:hypothetical protein n=1 Tax=Sphingopyxis sp. TaxID=1908224 RepID=UPI002D78D535|nr:hypothetical protein [Sphingopyxis sp.]HET6523549.1 hypothetical protein [Sphingopyxis sp.]